MNLAILAGEPSGDLLGATLIQSLKKTCPDLTVTGIGGPAMIAAGCRSLYNMERLSVMGLIEPLRRLPELIKIRRGIYQHFTAHRPDVFIGIDSPDFNLGLELKLRQQNIPVVHYVSPTVWAWRRKRIHKIAKAVDLMLTLFPFEADFYEKHQVPVKYVGHPFANQIPMQIDQSAARKKLNLDPQKIYIALLPGSRTNELKYLARTFLSAAALCHHERPDIEFITAAANEARHQEFYTLAKQFGLPIHFHINCARDVMAASDVVLAVSGTVTLEAMLLKRPMVIAYRTGNLSFQIARYLVKVPFIGLPNLLLNERVVPEFIQDEAQPEVLAAALLEFLNSPEKVSKIRYKFQDIHLQLRGDENAAAEALLSLALSSHKKHGRRGDPA